MAMSVISDLVSHAIELRYEELPISVIEAVKRSVLDLVALRKA